MKLSVVLKLLRKLFPDERNFILDIDSTDYCQYGRKMEGLAFIFKNNWGVDSLQAFDQFGFVITMRANMYEPLLGRVSRMYLSVVAFVVEIVKLAPASTILLGFVNQCGSYNEERRIDLFL